MGKHTEAFNRIMESRGGNSIFKDIDVSFAEAEGFCKKLSRETTEWVVEEIAKTKAKKFVTNREIWAFCKNNSIQPELQEAEQGLIDFDYSEEPEVEVEEVDYLSLEEFDDFNQDGIECFVLTNDTENKVLTYREHESMEKRTLNY